MEDIKIWVENNKLKRRRDALCIFGCCAGLIAVSAILIWAV